MKLLFLGTRANIEARTRRHRRHSALLVQSGRGRVMIDCGADWTRRVAAISPGAIVLTHAHPDHAWGLEQGAPCPVFATAPSWTLLSEFPIEERREVMPRTPIGIAGITFEAFTVVHSVRAPAVGYRISAGSTSAFYAPDVVAIEERTAALKGIALYIGDGATMTRPLVRRSGSAIFGHTTIRAQIGWCEGEHVPRAVFTHCGSEVLAAGDRHAGALVRQIGR